MPFRMLTQSRHEGCRTCYRKACRLSGSTRSQARSLGMKSRFLQRTGSSRDSCSHMEHSEPGSSPLSQRQGVIHTSAQNRGDLVWREQAVERPSGKRVAATSRNPVYKFGCLSLRPLWQHEMRSTVRPRLVTRLAATAFREAASTATFIRFARFASAISSL